jgi:hypothetical protein
MVQKSTSIGTRIAQIGQPKSGSGEDVDGLGYRPTRARPHRTLRIFLPDGTSVMGSGAARVRS